MRERRNDALRVNLDRKLKVKLHGTSLVRVYFISGLAHCLGSSYWQYKDSLVWGLQLIEKEGIYGIERQ